MAKFGKDGILEITIKKGYTSAGPNAVPGSKTTRHSQKYFPRVMKSTGRVNRESEPKVKRSTRSSGIPSFVEMVHEQNRIRRGR